MTQTQPSYRHVIGKIEPPIAKTLVEKFGKENVSNIIIFSEFDKVKYYIYESNELNSCSNVRPTSTKNIPSIYLDLNSNEKSILPQSEDLKFLLRGKYNALSEYILSKENFKHHSVDLDYVWKTNSKWTGFEFTTFFMPFKNKDVAEYYVKKLKRRKTWHGPKGPIAMRRIVECAEDLNINYYMVCANTIGKAIGSPINTAGNVYLFKLNNDQIERLRYGNVPREGIFCKFSEFISRLK